MESIDGEWEAPMRDAVKKIIGGIPVQNLDEIRLQCNERFAARHGTQKGFHPLHIIVSFAAEAENQILGGARPEDVYSFSNGAHWRERCRKALDEYASQGSSYLFSR